jgi:tetratricopeptide (TPR) repeat protein
MFSSVRGASLPKVAIALPRELVIATAVCVRQNPNDESHRQGIYGCGTDPRTVSVNGSRRTRCEKVPGGAVVNLTRVSGFALIAWVCLASPTLARAQSLLLTLPDVSQRASVSQRLGITDITVDYHRPLVAGRKIFGGLQPYGEVWRAGANYNTTVEFTDSVRVNGRVLPRGKYGLHMIPGASSFTVIFSRNATSWGSFTYDSTEDALRIPVSAVAIPLQEALTYEFDDPEPGSVVLTMKWERVAIPIKIDVDVPGIAAASLRSQLRGLVQTTWQAWEEAANYLLENSLNASEALQYAERAVYMEDRFETEITKARALKTLGREEEARMVQTKALAMGTQRQVYNFARTLQRVGQQNAAMEIYRNDVKRDSTSVYGRLEAVRLAVAAHDFPGAIGEAAAALAAASPSLKPAIEGLLAQLKDGVDINR